MLIYHSEVTLEAGFELLAKQAKADRLVRGRPVAACSGIELFKALRGSVIKCYRCACTADRWIADKGRSDLQGPPVLNLYGSMPSGELRLLTRDHIIPKSVGGIDAVENLRTACAPCNEERGNKLTKWTLQFRREHMHLVSPTRWQRGYERALANSNKALLLPFKQIIKDDERTAAQRRGNSIS